MQMLITLLRCSADSDADFDYDSDADFEVVLRCGFGGVDSEVRIRRCGFRLGC